MADYRTAARRAAAKYGLDPDTFSRQINQESGFNPGAVSPAGALGIAQIMPATARGWGVNPHDPLASLDAAAKNMAGYVNQFGSYRDALVAYNAGPGRVGKSLPAETVNYIKTILGGRNPSPITRAASSEPQTGYQRQTQLAPTAEVLALPERKRAPVTGPELPEFARKGAAALQAISSSAAPDRNRVDLRGALTTLSANAASLQQSQKAAPAADIQRTQKSGSKVLELIFNDGGKGYGIKNGQVVDGKSVYSGVWDGHADHVHLAAGPKTTVQFGKLAEQMGLHVGENPHFGGVDPVHVPGSYHYKGEAIDVSGDARKMAAFAKRVMDYQRGR